MVHLIHKPEQWNQLATALWRAEQRDTAIKTCIEELDADVAPLADKFIQPAYYAFQMERFDIATALLEQAIVRFPDHPMILLMLGSSYSRWRKHEKAIPVLDRFLASGIADPSAFDALAMSCAATGDTLRARLFGTMSLNEKDALTKDRHGTPRLNLGRKPGKKRNIIAFSLFGSHPRYLRGALLNVLAARTLYPDWTCRFMVDGSVDTTFCNLLADEGAEVVQDTSGNDDIRHCLTRRFLVADDPTVGYFMVRDCDSVVFDRELAAVEEWIASGLPFHAMRDWYTHTDPMLAGLWGGIAGIFPDLGGALADFTKTTPFNTNWDQFFLRDRIWPAIRDHIMVHDRYFSAHAARPFPTATPQGEEHVGQNEHAIDKAGQITALAAYAERVPALALPRSVKLDFKLG